MMLQADPQRLLESIDTLARFGGSDQGMNRFAYTPEEQAALTHLKACFTKAGLEVREDAVGNVFARWEGTEPGLPPLVTGSHIDTVRNGGRYDGALGVLAAFEAIRVLKDNACRLRHSIDLFISRDEEGTRFNATLFGTAAMTGQLTEQDLAKVDSQGVSVAQAMTAQGYDPAAWRQARLSPGDLTAYLEVHIEQGRILETEGIPIGIVTGIAGPLWLKVTLRGQAGHAGATPMRIRRDPMVAAARLMMETDRIARRFDHTVATTGQIKVLPGSTNVIPAEVEYTIDLRDVSMTDRSQAEADIRTAARIIADDTGVSIDLQDLVRVPSVPNDEGIMTEMETAAGELGLATLRMPSGAGHDAMHIGQLCPFGMIFVPSRNGWSHRPDEYTPIEDCANGANVLIHTLIRLDERLATDQGSPESI